MRLLDHPADRVESIDRGQLSSLDDWIDRPSLWPTVADRVMDPQVALPTDWARSPRIEYGERVVVTAIVADLCATQRRVQVCCVLQSTRGRLNAVTVA